MKSELEQACERVRLAKVKWFAAYSGFDPIEFPVNILPNRWVEDLQILADAYLESVPNVVRSMQEEIWSLQEHVSSLESQLNAEKRK